MSIKQTWAIATEKRLVHEAGCLGELLEQFRDRIPPALIGDREWKSLLARVRDLPVTIAAFPFGFEVPLHESNPRADFGASLVGGSRTAEILQGAAESARADLATAGMVSFLNETDREESPLRRIAGRKIMVEYDIDSPLPDKASSPAVFLYPEGQTLAGGGGEQQLEDLGIILGALDTAVNQEPDSAERQQVELVYRALSRDMYIRSVGTFPGRTRIVRLALMGFNRKGSVTEFLERAGWPGLCSLIDPTLSPIEESGAPAEIGLHLDVDASGVGPTLGLSLYAPEGQFMLKGREYWTAIIDGIRAAGIAVPEKLSALLEWSAGSEPLSGESGPFMSVRGIHHLKITVTGDQVGPVKGYIFLLLFSWPLEVGPHE
ncbi:MAG: hypothetical protein OXI88_12370 [Gammaproteobacteria bacterium]|nr:hypothetical protein [Gammaproteobacteria bacterium]MDE0512569.1 hypothetical protein [Gammaproteobacteria bacterium]